MAQYEMNLRDYWRIVRRRRLVIIASTVLVAIFSFWFAKQKVPVYQATAAVRYEQSTSLAGLLVEVLSYSGGDPIETQATIIKSFPVLEQVAKRLGMLPATAAPAAVRESKTYTAVLEGLAARIKTSRVGGTNIIEISVTSTNPREARDLANTVAEVYKAYAATLRNARITDARQFIEQQLREVEGRVKRTEEEMWAFREANRVISPGAESTVLLSLFTQLRGDIERTRQQRTELELAQSRLTRAGAASREPDPVFLDTNNPAVARLQASLGELKLERNNLALELTDKHPRLQVIDDRIRELTGELRREVAAQIAQLRTREEILGRQIGELFQKNREVPAVELALQRLQRETKVNDDLLTLLKTKHQEALIKEAERVDEVTMVRPASEPSSAVGGETTNTVLAGALIGLILGLVLAFVQETLDTSIGTIEDVESYLEVPVLGIIPHIDPRETSDRLIERRPSLAQMDKESLDRHSLLITHFDPKSPVAEAYRTLRSNIQFARVDQPGKVFVVTSPTLQEGKTTTIVNLALTMAQSGQRTLLVGANLRRPSIYRFFGIEREPGLSDILVGSVRWQDCIRNIADLLMGRFEMEDLVAAPGLDNLHIIESGPIPANPSELLSTPALATFLREVREQYDIVLIDTPPVLPVTDSAIVAGQADGVILVYQAGKVGRLILKRAKVHLENARARVWGVVLNDVQAEISGYATYTHYYTHYYGEEGAPGAPAPPKNWLERARSVVTSVVTRPTRKEADAEAMVLPEVESRGVPRRTSLALLVAVLLALAIAAGLVWWSGWSPPKTLLHERFWLRLAGRGAGTAPAPRPPAPAARPAAPVAVPAPSPPAPPASSARAAESVAPPAPSRESPPRATPLYALEFGPFATVADAERAQRRLAEAGYEATPARRRVGGTVYAVLIDDVPAESEARALAASLRTQGFPESTVTGAGGTYTVRVGEPAPLRFAIEVAERLKANGHIVRVAAEPGEAVHYAVRHGRYADPDEAERKSQEVRQLGLQATVVRIK